MHIRSITLTWVRVPLVEPFRISSGSAAETDAQDLRRRVAALELACERRVQYRLADLIPAGAQAPAPLAAAEANLALYLGPVRAASDEAVALRAALAAMLRR